MSTAAGLRSLAGASRAIPARLAVPTALAVAVTALLVLAGSSFGSGALFFCIPAGVAALLVALRIDARQQGLRLISQQDALTGLGNRRLLTDRLNYEIARHRRHSRRFSVFALDLDGFKQVNDQQGHAEGDRLLVQAGRAWSRALRHGDLLARSGGDEFVVLLPDAGESIARRVAGRLERQTPQPLGVSVGLAVSRPGEDAGGLLSRADAAL